MPSAQQESLLWDNVRLKDPHHLQDKSTRVQAMFDEIAPTYERVNRWLSAGRDSYWRKRAVELARIKPTDRVLDLACGTGDFTRAFAAAGPALVVGMDFSQQMLKLAANRRDKLHWCRADALQLPLGDACFDVVSCAFGVRNFQHLSSGVKEMHRILRPGGRAVILEFSMPRSGLATKAYLAYFRHVLPVVATWISGDRTGAYSYLPKSVSSFIDSDGMNRCLRESGFSNVLIEPLTMQVVTVYVAEKIS